MNTLVALFKIRGIKVDLTKALLPKSKENSFVIEFEYDPETGEWNEELL